MSFSIEPSWSSSWMIGGTPWSSLRLAKGTFLLGQPLLAIMIIVCSWSSSYFVFLAIDLFSDHCASSDKAQGPVHVWACVPTIALQNPVFPSYPRRKVGFWCLKNKFNVLLWFPHVRMSFCVSHNRSWCFVTRDISLNVPGSALFLVFYGEIQILRLAFPLEFWAG